jgi:hypothetical protein
MTTVADGLFHHGGSPVGFPFNWGNQPDPKTYFVNPDIGSDSYNGTKVRKPLATIAEAYSRCRSSAGDTIVLSTSSAHNVDAGGLTMSKSRINVLSADFHGRLVQQGAKVVSASSTDTAAFVLKNTGVRNAFSGIKFIQESTDSAALTAVQDGGEGTLWDHSSFVFGVVDNLGGTTAHEFVAGSDSATYNNCLFGTETLLTSAARSVFLIDQVTTSQEFKSNLLKHCTFLISSSEANAVLIEVSANTDVLFTNLFRHAVFMASLDSAGGVAITNAVKSAGSLVKGTLNFYLPASFNCTNLCAGTTAQVQTYGPATSAQAGEAGTPA